MFIRTPSSCGSVASKVRKTRLLNVKIGELPRCVGALSHADAVAPGAAKAHSRPSRGTRVVFESEQTIQGRPTTLEVHEPLKEEAQ
jgi:hypothetical protein